MKYRVIFDHRVKKDLRRISGIILSRIERAMLTLCDNPFPEGVKKIFGYTNIYRLRVGDYRIVYEVAQQIRIITVIRIGHRKDVYRVL